MARAGVGCTEEIHTAGHAASGARIRGRRLRASKTFGDRAALYLEIEARRRRAVLAAFHASGAAARCAPTRREVAQDCSKGSFHCAVNSSSAAEAAIESTGASAA